MWYSLSISIRKDGMGRGEGWSWLVNGQDQEFEVSSGLTDLSLPPPLFYFSLFIWFSSTYCFSSHGIGKFRLKQSKISYIEEREKPLVPALSPPLQYINIPRKDYDWSVWVTWLCSGPSKDHVPHLFVQRARHFKRRERSQRIIVGRQAAAFTWWKGTSTFVV